MALNQTNKLVWIVETIYKAQKITFEDLNRKWMENIDLSGGEEMKKNQFVHITYHNYWKSEEKEHYLMHINSSLNCQRD